MLTCNQAAGSSPPPYRVIWLCPFNASCYVKAPLGRPSCGRHVSCWINNASPPLKQVVSWPIVQLCPGGQVCLRRVQSFALCLLSAGPHHFHTESPRDSATYSDKQALQIITAWTNSEFTSIPLPHRVSDWICMILTTESLWNLVGKKAWAQTEFVMRFRTVSVEPVWTVSVSRLF